MALGFVTAIRTARATVVRDAIDAGAGPGKVRIYSGTKPAVGGTATTQLAELILSDPCGTVTSGVLTFSAVSSDVSADATGTASWARWLDSDNNIVVDGTVGTSGADINFNTLAFVIGGTVAVTSIVWTEGNA
jgi:hypothetical protein